jgi:hypothetical protein
MVRQLLTQCLKQKQTKIMKVKAPEGYHWMKSGKDYKLMKDPKEGFKPHKSAFKSVDFPIQKVHKS